jgi:phospholipid/cholesterol/gamma-HCH transport system substrate-binding protein
MKIGKEFKVGIFAIFAISTLYLGFNYLKGINFFSKTKNYYIVYDNVDGLDVSSTITLSGYAVGRVSRITILQQHDNKILVEATINSDIIMGDSTVALLKGDFLGTKSIQLVMGDIQKPLQHGDTLIAQLDKGIMEILAEGAQPVTNSVEATIKKINAIIDNLSGSSMKIVNTIDNLEAISTTVRGTTAENRQKLKELVDNLNTLTKSLNTQAGNVGVVMDKYGSLADSLKAIDFNATLGKVNQTVENLNATILAFKDSEGTLGKLVSDDALYNNLNEAMKALDALLLHLNENPKHFFAPLGKSRKQIEREQKRNADN